MTTARSDSSALQQRPKRADALRNYEKLLAAARDAFTQDGTSAALEDIARRAGVGIGTLYRHFPTRKHLLEAVYVDEVEAISRAAQNLDDLPPWEALVQWLHEYVGFAATKRAVADELIAYIDQDAEVFASCRAAIMGAGDGLLQRGQQAGVVRPDATFADVGRLVGGIATIRGADPEQIARILDMALDGLRYVPPAE